MEARAAPAEQCGGATKKKPQLVWALLKKAMPLLVSERGVVYNVVGRAETLHERLVEEDERERLTKMDVTQLLVLA